MKVKISLKNWKFRVSNQIILIRNLQFCNFTEDYFNFGQRACKQQCPKFKMGYFQYKLMFFVTYFLEVFFGLFGILKNSLLFFLPLKLIFLWLKKMNKKIDMNLTVILATLLLIWNTACDFVHLTLRIKLTKCLIRFCL